MCKLIAVQRTSINYFPIIIVCLSSIWVTESKRVSQGFKTMDSNFDSCCNKKLLDLQVLLCVYQTFELHDILYNIDGNEFLLCLYMKLFAWSYLLTAKINSAWNLIISEPDDTFGLARRKQTVVLSTIKSPRLWHE